MNQRSGTLAAWIKPERWPPVKYIESVIDADLPGQPGSGWGLSAGKIKVILDNEFWDTGVRIRFNPWQHVALSFDATEAHLYLDGELAATHHYRQGNVSPQRYVIGKSAANPLYFQGQVQDVRIYDQVLTSKTLAALAQAPPP